ncbi:hypothetical protein BGX34_005700, partial [Mortierella sp. NVP85]
MTVPKEQKWSYHLINIPLTFATAPPLIGLGPEGRMMHRFSLGARIANSSHSAGDTLVVEAQSRRVAVCYSGFPGLPQSFVLNGP